MLSRATHERQEDGAGRMALGGQPTKDRCCGIICPRSLLPYPPYCLIWQALPAVPCHLPSYPSIHHAPAYRLLADTTPGAPPCTCPSTPPSRACAAGQGTPRSTECEYTRMPESLGWTCQGPRGAPGRPGLPRSPGGRPWLQGSAGGAWHQMAPGGQGGQGGQGGWWTQDLKAVRRG